MINSSKSALVGSETSQKGFARRGISYGQLLYKCVQLFHMYYARIALVAQNPLACTIGKFGIRIAP